MSDSWRTGRKVGRTVYIGDDLVGVLDTPELAEIVVNAVNGAAFDSALLEANEGLGEALVEIGLAVGLRPAPHAWCSKTAILAAVAELRSPNTAQRLMTQQIRRTGQLSVALRNLVEVLGRDDGEDLTPLLEQAKEVLADNTIYAETPVYSCARKVLSDDPGNVVLFECTLREDHEGPHRDREHVWLR